MWVFMPSRAAASASMRPSCPPPRMPITLPGGSGPSLRLIGRELGDGLALLAPIGLEAFVELGVVEREDRGGEKRGVGRTGFPDRERADRDARRHLDDRE